MTVRASPSEFLAPSVLADVLIDLSEMSETAAAIEVALASRVEVARTEGATWAQIGQALGVTRQSAWQRFSDQV